MSAILLVRLKITDLSAWTALETGRRLIEPGHDLSRPMLIDFFIAVPSERAGRAVAGDAYIGEAARGSEALG